MKHVPISSWLTCLAAAVVLWLSGPAPGHAAGVVTNCTTFGPGAGTLQAALTGGGTVTFACSGTIAVTTSLFVSVPTVIDGRGQAVVISGNKTFSLFFVSNTTLDLIAVTLADAVANAGAGPAVFVASGARVTVTDCIITRNATTQSGALFLDTGGVSLRIVNSAITDNTAAGLGAGIRADGALLTIENSTLSGNRTTGTFGAGPAISVAGSATVATVTNSTISGNIGSPESTSRSAIFSNGSLTLINSTVAANDGGGLRDNSGTVTLINSIVASQLAGPDCETDAVVSGGHNLDSDGTCNLTAEGDQPNRDPLLGPLQDNGGPTSTHALLPGSPAINAGSNADCPPTDQRGLARPQGPTCDIGAYEFDALLAMAEVDGSVFAAGQTVTYRGTVNPGLAPVVVDIYFGAFLPDFATFLSLVEGAPGEVEVVLGAEPVPFRQNVPAESLSVEFEYTFGGAELAGLYTTFAAVTVAGSDPLEPENRLSLDLEAFVFNPE